MKKINKLFLIIALIISVQSCKKDENKITFEGGTAPVVTKVSGSNDTVLLKANRSNEFVSLSWTNPNYRFTTGSSSQDVTYTLQFDTVGSNFTNPSKYEIQVSKSLNTTITVGDLNTYLTKMSLSADMAHNIEVRIVSNLSGTVPLSSNVINLGKIQPFEDFVVAVPVSNTLFITGAATPGGWQAGVTGEAVPANQQFVQVSRGHFEIASLHLNGDQSFLLLPVYGSWASKYGGTGANNTNNQSGDSFKEGGGDLKAPSVTGDYKIEVNFVLGKYTITKL